MLQSWVSRVLTAAGLFVASAVAAPPQRFHTRATSPGGNCEVRLVSAGRGAGDARRPPLAMLSERGAARQEACTLRLVNDVRPEYVFVPDHGAFVLTLNERGRGGARHALVAYGAEGHVIRSFQLSELLTDDDAQYVRAVPPHAAGEGRLTAWLAQHEAEGAARLRSVDWLQGADFAWSADQQQLLITLGWGARLRVAHAGGSANASVTIIREDRTGAGILLPLDKPAELEMQPAHLDQPAPGANLIAWVEGYLQWLGAGASEFADHVAERGSVLKALHELPGEVDSALETLRGAQQAALTTGRMTDALGYAIELGRVARELRREPTFRAQIRSRAFREAALNGMLAAIAGGADTDLAALRQELASEAYPGNPDPDFSAAFLLEEIGTLEALECGLCFYAAAGVYRFSDELNEALDAIPEGRGAPRTYTPAERQSLLDELQRSCLLRRQALAQPCAEAQAQLAHLESEYEEQLLHAHPILRVAYPSVALSRYHFLYSRTEAKLRAARLVIELSAAHKDGQPYPPALPPLDVAVDPFTDAPFCYSSDGQSFALRSLGPDGVPSADDLALWPPP